VRGAEAVLLDIPLAVACGAPDDAVRALRDGSCRPWRPRPAAAAVGFRNKSDVVNRTARPFNLRHLIFEECQRGGSLSCRLDVAGGAVEIINLADCDAQAARELVETASTRCQLLPAAAGLLVLIRLQQRPRRADGELSVSAAARAATARRNCAVKCCVMPSSTGGWRGNWHSRT